MDVYHTITDVSEGFVKEKGSKFLSFAHPVRDLEAIKDILEHTRKQYHDARHVCYAYRLGPLGEDFRSSDDGEPSGTAGRPILGQLRSVDVTDVLVVVVRYFGGTLLGTGGLIQAYKDAAREALDSAVILEKTVDEEFSVYFDFEHLNAVMRLIKLWEARIVSEEYNTACSMRLSIRKAHLDGIKEAIQKIDFTCQLDD